MSRGKGLKSSTIREKCEVIDWKKDNVYDILNALQNAWEYYNKPQGIAAPQLGITKRAVLCRLKGKPHYMVNPTVKFKFGSVKSNEGCESIVGRYIVKRPLFGVVEYWDHDGMPCRMFCGKKEIRVVCHEVDHLDGICIDVKGVPVECSKRY